MFLKHLSLFDPQWNLLPKSLGTLAPVVPNGGFLKTLDNTVFNLGLTEPEMDFLMGSSSLILVRCDGVLELVEDAAVFSLQTVCTVFCDFRGIMF